MDKHPWWSVQEKKLLKKLYPNNSTKDVANRVGRSITAVSMKAYTLGLRKLNQYRLWSKKELNLLKKLYPTRTAQQLADQLGRSVLAVRLRIVKLGLKKRKYKTKN